MESSMNQYAIKSELLFKDVCSVGQFQKHIMSEPLDSLIPAPDFTGYSRLENLSCSEPYSQSFTLR